MSRVVSKDWKKFETNSDSQLEVTWDGTLCLEKIWITNSFANSCEVIVSTIGKNMICLES